MDNILEKISKFAEKLKKHNVSEYTAQCAYFTLLSFIPFLMLIVTLIQYTGIDKNSLISIIQNIMPETMKEITIDIVQEVFSKSISTVSISAIFVLWSAKKGFYALLKGLQNIYEVDRDYNIIFMQIKSIILTTFLALSIISVLLISVFGSSILELIKMKINIENNVIHILNLSKIGIYFILFLILVLMYRFVPGHKQSIKKQIPGAIIATLGWYVISLFFKRYSPSCE